MEVIGDYRRDGHALIKGLVPVEVARVLLQNLYVDLANGPIPMDERREHSPVLRRPGFEFYGNHYKPLAYFLWGMTPAIGQLVGEPVVPTYDYFRVYREGDICKVHADRPSCEHSVSLTLAHSDGKAWPLELAERRVEGGTPPITDNFGGDDFTSIEMGPGDAALYQGVRYRHGRTTPNPNRWTAHLFLHFVSRDGPSAAHAFDGKFTPGDVDFEFV